MILRALSAIAGVILIFCAGWFFGKNGLACLSGIVTLLATYEYSFMVEKESLLLRAVFVGLSYSFFLIFVLINNSILLFLFCFIVLSSIFVVIKGLTINARIVKLSQWLMGIIYCGSLTGIVARGTLEIGIFYFALLLAISFSTDTFAYLGGKLYGKTKLIPHISPNKTIEGGLTGLVGGVIGGFICMYLMDDQIKNISPLDFIETSGAIVLISALSQIGDLFESLLKRYSGVKDSGSILPGHGGILDRIDGLLFAGPVLFLTMIELW